MLSFLKRNRKEAVQEKEPTSFWGRFTQGLKKTKAQWHEQLLQIIYGKKQIDQVLLDDLESCLLSSDMGVETTSEVIRLLTAQVDREALQEGKALLDALKNLLVDRLKPYEGHVLLETDRRPEVVLMVGVNGAGKTTTLGKLAYYFKSQNKKIILAAGDTFRAAAVEQLIAWGQTTGVSVVNQEIGSDSASVVFDAFQSARANHCDLMLADTAGRLHTQQHLMEELKKVKRVLSKLDPKAPHHIWLVLDASIGQNAMRQVQLFHEALGLTGLCMTKLDGSAKGGLLFALTHRFSLPIYFIGMGEQPDDLRPFSAEHFVQALLASNG